MALDVSNSMLAQDLKPDRMEVAKRALAQLIDRMKGDRLGIVVFAGEAFTQLPITADRSAAKLFLSSIGPDMVNAQGTAIGAAIDLAHQSFQPGGAKGKAIIVLNPAEPPLMMRDTVYTLSDFADEEAIAASVERMAADVQAYVPGYRLKQRVQFDRIEQPILIPGVGRIAGLKTSIFLEVEGAAHYLPAYAGNLDIMTSAALRTAESMAARLLQPLTA